MHKFRFQITSLSNEALYLASRSTAAVQSNEVTHIIIGLKSIILNNVNYRIATYLMRKVVYNKYAACILVNSIRAIVSCKKSTKTTDIINLFVAHHE